VEGAGGKSQSHAWGWGPADGDPTAGHSPTGPSQPPWLLGEGPVPCQGPMVQRERKGAQAGELWQLGF
jgi:hypothetical protein